MVCAPVYHIDFSCHSVVSFDLYGLIKDIEILAYWKVLPFLLV